MIYQRGVRLVPDRRDDRGEASRYRSAQRLVGERQQVLHAAAASGQHDDVHRGVSVEHSECLDDLTHRQRTLHRDVADPKLHRGPAGCGVAEHIALSGTGPTGHQPDAAG